MEKFIEKMVDILDAEEEVTMESVLEDIEEWDSLSHIQLMKAIEGTFGIKFTAKEVLDWEDIHDCVDSIEAKL